VGEKTAIKCIGWIRAEAYENARSYKERAKLFYDIHIPRKEFSQGIKVLQYDSRLHIFPWKLRSRWIGPCIVSHVFAYDAIEIGDPGTVTLSKVNGQ